MSDVGYMTEERRMMQESARDFVANEVLPVANELDPVEGEIPMDLRQKMGEMGYFGIRIPEEFGGLGLGTFEYCMIAEELARGWMSCASIIARSGSWMHMVNWPEAKRRELTERSAMGDYLHSGALSEPDAGSDLFGSIKTRAVLDGDEWVITGNKYWCTFADGSDVINVLARLEGEEKRSEHPELCGGEAREVSCRPVAPARPFRRSVISAGKPGSCASKVCAFRKRTSLAACRARQLPPALGGGGGSLAILSIPRVHTAARAIGLARGALEDATRYAQERVQFGRPISEFQETRFKLARMASEIEAARALMYQVCTQIDAGAGSDEQASMVKWFATEMAERVTSDALQIFGGAGYTRLHAIERYWRDARLTKIFEGTSEIQLKIISDRMLGKATRGS